MNNLVQREVKYGVHDLKSISKKCVLLLEGHSSTMLLKFKSAIPKKSGQAANAAPHTSTTLSTLSQDNINIRKHNNKPKTVNPFLETTINKRL